MQNDEMIWQVINNQFCSFKTKIGVAKSDKSDFCRHPYSVTGLCNRSHCPLANSKYATIREEDGRVNLYVKTVERAHSPKNLWEKIHLSRNYSKALGQLDEHLAYFPKALVHRNKQRLTKIHQYLIRMRKIKLKELSGKKAKMVGINRKIDQREERREKKALVAAKVEANIEKELVERLAKGTYGDIYNFPEAPYQKALDTKGIDEEEEEEEVESEEEESESEEEEGVVEYVEDLEEFDEEDESEAEDVDDMEYLGDNQWGSGSGDSSEEEESGEDESSSEDEDEGPKKKPPKKKADDARKQQKRRRGTHVEIEYEEEMEEPEQHEEGGVAGAMW